MKKYKVCVYAISKNESKFVDRWYDSIKDADKVFVLDTGSSDDTVKKLKEKGVIVKEEKIEPWRFDVARNMSLDMVDEDCDICVCVDLDEVFVSGWRNKLEKLWDSNVTRVRYNYNWRLDEFNNPVVNFYIDKIHCRNGYKWVNPVHEVLSYDGVESYVTTDDITVNHYPDDTKSRGGYLPLLELSVLEDPSNDRNMHYLGREYMYYGRWNESIDTLIKHLNLKSSTWRDERCASMRFISRCYSNLKRYDEARMWLDKAIKEAPYLRDPFMERALLEYDLSNWEDMVYYCNEALKINEHSKSYINEVFSWNNTVYDLLSIGYYYLGNVDKALFFVKKALDMDNNNDRLIKNKHIFEEFLNNNK